MIDIRLTVRKALGISCLVLTTTPLLSCATKSPRKSATPPAPPPVTGPLISPPAKVVATNIALPKTRTKSQSRPESLEEQTAKMIANLGRNPMRAWQPPTASHTVPDKKRASTIGDPVTSKFPVDGDVVYLPVPNGLFETCIQAESGATRSTSCQDTRTRSAFTVSAVRATEPSILTKSGLAPESPRVHEFDPRSAAQPGASLPMPWVCRPAKMLPPLGLAGRGSGACFAMIKNAGRPGAFKLLAKVESLGRVYEFVFSSDDARLVNYAQAWLQFAALRAVSSALLAPPTELPAPSANSK